MYKMICSLLLICSLAACQSSQKNSDVYQSFAQLQKLEDPQNYKIETKKRNSDILVLAPHGGSIEFGTSEIAAALASNDWSYYSFKGLMPKGNRRLHITSSRFDEPQALSLANQHEVCISVHGFSGDRQSPNICFGGRNDDLAQRLHEKLLELGMQNSEFANSCNKYYGQQESNIVNRCALEGVQMEMSKAFRDELLKDKKLLNRFKSAVREVVGSYLRSAQQ